VSTHTNNLLENFETPHHQCDSQSSYWITFSAFWYRTRGLSSLAQRIQCCFPLSRGGSITTPLYALPEDASILIAALKPDCLSNLISENPNILNYVRILQIQVDLDQMRTEDQAIMTQLDEFAETLLMFPFLESIILTTSKKRVWYWPDVFRAAWKIASSFLPSRRCT